MSSLQLVTLDIESYYSDEYSLSKLTTEAYIRDRRFQVIGVSIKHGTGETQWYTGDKDYIAGVLHSIDWSNTGLIAHNAAFDGAILNWHFDIRPKFVFCTMSMGRPEFALRDGVSLLHLARQLGVGEKGDEVLRAINKRREDFTPEELRTYGDYCDLDAELTFKCFVKLAAVFPRSELKVIDILIRMFTEPVVLLDSDMLTEHLNSVREHKESLLRAALQDNREALNSAKKFGALLEAEGITVPMKWNPAGTKQIPALAKTDAEFKALLEHPNPMVQALVAARLGMKSTLEETRTESFLRISVRGALAIMLNYYGGHTGRASGGDGINLQNLPKGGALRCAMMAPPGYTLVVGDSSQIEARILPWLAEQDDLLDSFRSGRGDMYAEFALEMYGRTITKDDPERQAGKIAILALGYGMGAERYQATLKQWTDQDMELSECQKVVNFYRRKYRKIKALWDKCAEAIEYMYHFPERRFDIARGIYTQNGRIYLPNGLFLQYPNLTLDEDGWTYTQRRKVVRIYGSKIVENIIQALARIVVFDQMVILSGRYKVALTVHDELVAVVPEDEIVEGEAFVAEAMKYVPPWLYGAPISCATGVDKRYGVAKT